MSKYETPDYDVLLKEDEYEIRRYPGFNIVEYESLDENTSGFQYLFKYISKDNKENKKISMTVPVIQEENNKIAFIVPEEFADKVPEPNNPKINIKKFDEGLFGVIRYSGLSNDAKELKMMEKLEKWLKEKAYEKQSEYMLASYNAPFTLPMLRRNEIWIRVKKY